MTDTIRPFGRSERRYARILELAADAIICIDDRQRIVMFNTGAEKTFGYAASDILGQTIDHLIPERFRSGHARHVDRFADGHSAARHMGDRQAIFARHKSGREFPAEATISRITEEDGYFLTVVLRDISERFAAEEQRRLDAEKLRQALTAGKLGGFEQNFETGQIMLFGDACAILGLSKSICQRDELLALIHEDDRDAVRQATGSLDETGLFNIEYRLRKPGGSVVWIRSIGSLVSDERRNRHVFGTVQDITDQKDVEHELERRVAERTEALRAEVRQREETQKQLVRAQRLEAFGQLTGGVAHDFNNLLTVIGGNLELIQEYLTGERAQRQIRRAIEAVGMGSRLTQRLLTFARRSNLEPEILNLNDQVLNIIDLLRRTIGETITISSVLAPDLGRVKADASQVENAILNLAINARDAMPAGGKLAIETANAEIGEMDELLAQDERIIPGSYIHLAVTDTGTGMTPEVLARAFEPFFTTKEHGRGTGLGLATLYGFARQSGGYVTIASEVGRGTTVNIYLPRADPPPSGPAVATPTDAAAITMRILVVEDNPDIREVTTQRLEKLNHQFVACESGPEAVAILAHDQAFDLVFSDIMMAGGMSGYDLARWLHNSHPSIPILLTTGFAGDQPGQTVNDFSHLRVLRKPYATADLAEAIRDVREARTGDDAKTGPAALKPA